jgi:hypothetical protein
MVKLKLTKTDGEIVDAKLYCHQETVSIGGTNYYLLKLDTSADASGTTLSVSTASTGRFVLGKFVFQLTGCAKINSATINAIYRAYTGGGTVHDDIDILIRQSNGTVRTTIATDVSISANLGTSWATYTGADYSFAEYTIVDQTDYLEIDYYAHVTVSKTGRSTYLRIDDNTLALADQTRSQEWSFQYPPPVLHDLEIDGLIFDDAEISLIVELWKKIAYDPNYNVNGWRKIYTVVPAEWLTGWSYRKSHVINSASGAGTNYQVKITVHYGSGTDSGADVYLNGHCRTDFGDIRFTDDDGVTLLDYWMETKVDSNYAIFWVEVADDLSSNNATIYVYYGKSDATTTSNGNNTFAFFDDFPGTSIDTNKWTVDSGIVYTVSNSILEVTDVPANSFDTKTGFHHSGVPSQNSFEVRLKGFSWTQSDQSFMWRFGVILSDTTAYDYELCVRHNDDWSSQYGEKKARIGSNTYGSGTNTLPQNGSAELIIRKDQSNNVNILWDGSVILGPYTDTVTLTEILLYAVRYQTYAYPTTDLDAVIWRKYVSPEPNHGSWGSEETYAPSNWAKVLYEYEL